ncbi:hypothetical protein A5724_26910 [Mycobacterium sp. ACS1612]|uniref:hypothetical protein n=1 Tax=Mycobacterium sp. ACS1612 TaxID=1834117 RepID=UPI0007FD52C5|nr:hypothetical protein [Mycobacterium sp. ACS1612]OBF29017.1 hypothetical protein A5724_26910 [Mycobacterium sp. ACS1612]
MTKVTARRIIVGAMLSPAAALLVLSPGANAADQVINGPVKQSVVQKQNLSQAPDAKIRDLTNGGTHIRCIRIRVWHDGYVLTRVRCVGWRD